MKTAVSIPDPTFRKADRVARQLGVSRSRLYALALEQYIDARRNSHVTERLNEVYASESSELDPVLDAMQFASLPAEGW